MRSPPRSRLTLFVVALTLGLGGPAARAVAGDGDGSPAACPAPGGEGPPPVGSPAPDFVLTGVDGGQTVRLSDLRGKPVVLFFGSCTCRFFCQSTGEIDAVRADYQGEVHTYAVYIREAHAIAGLPTDSPSPPPEPTNRDRDRRVGAWTAAFALLGGAEVVVLLYARALGRRRFVLASLLLAAGAGAVAAGFVLTTPADLTPAIPFALGKPAVEPRTLEERAEVARYFAREFRLAAPLLVDALDDKVEADYQALPVRVYVIDQEGKVAYQGGAGPGGYEPAEVRPVLDRLLGRAPR
ncbi:MAG TPA: deiodinase-like protein [Gemmataceae bacterium]|nr:deiodinase-like protein [Gemmataceae bacterium]